MIQIMSRTGLSLALMICAATATAGDRPTVGTGMDIDLSGFNLASPATDMNDTLCNLMPEACGPDGGSSAGSLSAALGGSTERPITVGTGGDIDPGTMNLTDPATDLNTVICDTFPEHCDQSGTPTATSVASGSAAVMTRMNDLYLLNIAGAVQVEDSSFYDVLLEAKVGDGGALEFTVVSITPNLNPESIGAMFSSETGQATIPALEVNIDGVPGIYSLVLQLVPGSDPPVFVVVSSTLL